jgi:flagellar hook-associated protein 1
MSIPTLQGLQTALSGLVAEQTAMDTTGNNISNANTEGYSRETALLEPNPPLDIPAVSTLTGQGAQLGAGVTVANITRIRNVYLDSQYRAQNGALGGASAQAEELQQAQAAFNEPSDASVATAMSSFWTAWNNLAQAPTSEAAKEAVEATGKQLASTINQLASQLSTISGQVSEQVSTLTGPGGEIENYATEIAQLNTQIKLSEEAGQQPNEVLDRRDLLLDKLSALGNITVSEQPDHTDTVSFGDAAKPLVEGEKVNWPQAITEASGGKVGALLGLNGAKGALTELQNGLDGVAETLANTVNAQIPPPAKPFFSGNTAATLAVAVKPAEVVAGGGGAHGNEVAQAIANLRGGEAERGYAALVEKLGGYVQTAKNDQSNLQTTVTAINDQRQSVSGVSLDEEMTNLIAFQRGYQASARTLSVMDEMLETLIDHTGSGL